LEARISLAKFFTSSYFCPEYLAAGLRFAGGTVLFLLVGLWLDRKLGTSPLLTLVGALLGAFLGGLSMYRELMADQANKPTWRGRKR
jgi:F0F1-type ATP synthase assembly protein I